MTPKELDTFIVKNGWYASHLFAMLPQDLAAIAARYQQNKPLYDEAISIAHDPYYFRDGGALPSNEVRKSGLVKEQDLAIASGEQRRAVPRGQKKKAISASLSQAVFRRDSFTCQICKTPGGNLTCDHIVPERRGGPTTLENLQTACHSCNSRKGNK